MYIKGQKAGIFYSKKLSETNREVRQPTCSGIEWAFLFCVVMWCGEMGSGRLFKAPTFFCPVVAANKIGVLLFRGKETRPSEKKIVRKKFVQKKIVQKNSAPKNFCPKNISSEKNFSPKNKNPSGKVELGPGLFLNIFASKNVGQFYIMVLQATQTRYIELIK
jgi:hypothetical protein